MKNLLILMVFLVSPSYVLARSAQVCPAIPAEAGYEWVYQEGVDFDLCYAVEAKTRRDVFGVYLGNHPGFKPERVRQVGTGFVSDHPVVWYSRDADTKSGLARETLVPLGERGFVAHVWLDASTEQELQFVLYVIERLHFGE